MPCAVATVTVGASSIQQRIVPITERRPTCSRSARAYTTAPRAVLTTTASSGSSAMRSALSRWWVSGVAGQCIERNWQCGSSASTGSGSTSLRQGHLHTLSASSQLERRSPADLTLEGLLLQVVGNLSPDSVVNVGFTETLNGLMEILRNLSTSQCGHFTLG